MVPGPDFFHGDRGQLEAFLAQVKLCLHFHESEFASEEEKVLFAMQYLRGPALHLFTPCIEDFLEKEPADRKAATVEIFQDFGRFEKEIERIFGDHGKHH